MNKMNNLKIIWISILIMLIASLCYYNIQLRNTIKISVELLKKSDLKQLNDSLQNRFLLNNVVLQLVNSDTKLNNITVEDLNSKTYQLKELINDKSKLIFMFSELNCQSCIDMQLPNIEQLSKDVRAENIILLASYSNKRDLFQFARINRIKQEIYSFDKNDIQIQIINSNVPFFFIINPNLTTTCFFIPDKSFPKHTNSFFNIVKHRFFGHLNESIH